MTAACVMAAGVSKARVVAKKPKAAMGSQIARPATSIGRASIKPITGRRTNKPAVKISTGAGSEKTIELVAMLNHTSASASLCMSLLLRSLARMRIAGEPGWVRPGWVRDVAMVLLSD